MLSPRTSLPRLFTVEYEMRRKLLQPDKLRFVNRLVLVVIQLHKQLLGHLSKKELRDITRLMEKVRAATQLDQQ